MLRDALFYLLVATLLGFAATTVLVRNLFRAALALLGVLWCTAILFIVLRAEMVALVQVMVYIGGIMIFVLYAVLLTSELGGKMAAPSFFKAAGAVIAAGTMVGVIVGFARRGAEAASAPEALPAENIASLKMLGLRLLDPGPNGFLIPFELISVVLLAAMVGAIAVAREHRTLPTSPVAGAPRVGNARDGA